VVVAQHFGSSLRVNLHYHALVLDGVYTEDADSGALTFHEARPPSDEEVAALVVLVRKRVERLLRGRGLLDDEGSFEQGELDAQQVMQLGSSQDRVATGQRAGAKVRVLMRQQEPELRGRRKLPPKCAESGYFNLHAGVRIAGRDTKGKERIARYLLRPPLVLSRLHMRQDGQLVLRLKKAWRNGVTAIVLSPFELLERLAALVLRPRQSMISYHGVLGANAAWRSAIVPSGDAERSAGRGALHSKRSRKKKERRPKWHSSWIPWADLLSRVFGVVALRCSCGLLMEVHAVVMGPPATVRALEALERSRWLIRGPPVSRSAA
jgi:hypothetical protein